MKFPIHLGNALNRNDSGVLYQRKYVHKKDTQPAVGSLTRLNAPHDAARANPDVFLPTVTAGKQSLYSPNEQ